MRKNLTIRQETCSVRSEIKNKKERPMVATTTITGLGHPIQQLSSYLFPGPIGKIDLVSDENMERARKWILKQIQFLQARLFLLDILEKAVSALSMNQHSLVVRLLDEKDFNDLDTTADDYEERGCNPTNLTGVAREVFEALLSCNLKPCIKPWVSSEESSDFALSISW